MQQPLAASSLTTQLELLLVTESGKLTDKGSPCDCARRVLLGGTLTAKKLGYITPGLDAVLCRCPHCLRRAEGGIWWFDAQMRDRVRTRKIPYCFEATGGVGDVAVEDIAG